MILVTFLKLYSKDILNSLYALIYLALCHMLALIVSQNHDKGQEGDGENNIHTYKEKLGLSGLNS